MSEAVAKVISTNLQQLALEPSRGLYFIKNHARRTVPALIAQQNQLDQLQADVQVASLDISDGIDTVKAMNTQVANTFSDIAASLQSLVASERRWADSTSNSKDSPR